MPGHWSLISVSWGQERVVLGPQDPILVNWEQEGAMPGPREHMGQEGAELDPQDSIPSSGGSGGCQALGCPVPLLWPVGRKVQLFWPRAMACPIFMTKEAWLVVVVGASNMRPLTTAAGDGGKGCWWVGLLPWGSWLTHGGCPWSMVSAPSPANFTICVVASPGVQPLVGQPLALMCQFDGSNYAGLVFSWYKDGKQLDIVQQELVLPQVQLEDAGEYHCKAHSALGTAASDSLSITVMCKGQVGQGTLCWVGQAETQRPLAPRSSLLWKAKPR